MSEIDKAERQFRHNDNSNEFIVGLDYNTALNIFEAEKLAHGETRKELEQTKLELETMTQNFQKLILFMKHIGE